MKKMKKIFALLIAMVMVLGMSTSVFAATETNGVITISNATNGITYTAYKIFDADANGSAITYTATAAQKATIEAIDGNPFDFLVDSTGAYTVTVKSDKTEADVTTWMKAHYKDSGVAVDTTGTTGTYSEATGNYTINVGAYGYYYVTTATGSAVTINSAYPTVTVEDKNDYEPGPHDNDGKVKKITKVNGNTVEATDTADAKIGDDIEFTLTFDAVNFENGNKAVTYYEFTDTPTGINLDTAAVSVSVGSKTLTATTEYTYTKNANGSATIRIPWAEAVTDTEGNTTGYKQYYAVDATTYKTTVTIVLKGTITEYAATANPTNTVKVDSNNGTIYNPGTPDDTIKTYHFVLNKVDENSKALTGAKFALTDNNGNAINIVLVPAVPASGTEGEEDYVAAKAAYYRLATSSDKDATNIIDLTEVASIEVSGLAKGTYKLNETQVPSGYNKAAEETVDVQTDVETNAVQKTIQNLRGTVLPSTGGIGTTIFYIIGAVLVIGAGVVLVTRRRMNAN